MRPPAEDESARLPFVRGASFDKEIAAEEVRFEFVRFEMMFVVASIDLFVRMSVLDLPTIVSEAAGSAYVFVKSDDVRESAATVLSVDEKAWLENKRINNNLNKFSTSVS